MKISIMKKTSVKMKSIKVNVTTQIHFWITVLEFDVKKSVNSLVVIYKHNFDVLDPNLEIKLTN